MQSTVISSTLFITLLMMIGLVFFIRASTKERIEVVQFAIAQPLEEALEQLQFYFLQRSYQSVEDVANVGDDAPKDASGQTADANVGSETLGATKRVFEGMVRPSIFLAILLFFIAAIGLLCLGLVLSILLPQLGATVWLLVLVAPVASFFYWKKSSRVEQVSFKVEPLADGSSNGTMIASTEHQGQPETKVTVMGHRDELASLQQSLVQQSLRIRTLELDLG